MKSIHTFLGSKTRLSFVIANLIVCSCVTTILTAQTWEWERSTDAINADGGGLNSIASDPFGHVFVGGNFNGVCLTFDTATIGSVNSSYIIIAKFDSSGNLLWQQYASDSGTYGIALKALATDNYGNCYATGYFGAPQAVFGSYSLTTAQTKSIFLVKYDAGGNVIWAENSTGTAPIGSVNEFVQDICIDNNGNIVMSGGLGDQYMSMGGSIVDNHLFYFGTNTSMLLVKFDSSGSLLWSTTAADPTSVNGYTAGNSVVTDASDNIYVVGDNTAYYLKFDTTILIGGNFLAKYNMNGSFKWAQCFGLDSSQTAISTIPCVNIDQTNNELYFSGTFDYSSLTIGGFTLANPLANTLGGVNSAFFLVNSDLNGNIQWAKTAAGSADVYSMTIDADHNINVSGYYWDSVIFFNNTYKISALSPATTYPGFMINYSQYGDVNWGFSLGKNNSYITLSLSADYYGDIYLTGNYLGDTVFYQNGYFTNTNRFSSATATNIFVAKLGSIESVPRVTANNINLLLFPNPASTLLNIQLSDPSVSSIKIFDCVGRTVNETALSGNANTVQIDITKLPGGVYFLQAAGKQNIVNKTFVVTK